MDDALKRWCSGECEGCENVHDQVDPDEHNGVEGALLERDDADKHANKDREVHGDLELEEALDVGVNVAATAESFDARLEVVVEQNERSLVARDRLSRSHGERNVSGPKSIEIRNAFSNDSNLLACLLEAFGNDLLVNWLGASNNLEGLNELFELLLVIGQAPDLASFIVCLLFHSNDSNEFFGSHCNFAGLASLEIGKRIGVDNSAVNSNVLGSFQVVTADEDHVDATVVLGLLNCNFDATS